jgi:hypothetical protein
VANSTSEYDEENASEHQPDKVKDVLYYFRSVVRVIHRLWTYICFLWKGSYSGDAAVVTEVAGCVLLIMGAGLAAWFSAPLWATPKSSDQPPRKSVVIYRFADFSQCRTTNGKKHDIVEYSDTRVYSESPGASVEINATLPDPTSSVEISDKAFDETPETSRKQTRQSGYNPLNFSRNISVVDKKLSVKYKWTGAFGNDSEFLQFQNLDEWPATRTFVTILLPPGKKLTPAVHDQRYQALGFTFIEKHERPSGTFYLFELESAGGMTGNYRLAWDWDLWQLEK